MSLNSRLFKLGLLASILAAAPMWGQNTLTVSCPAFATAGSKVACPVSLNLALGVQVDSLEFTLSTTPTSGVASYTDTLTGGLPTKSTTFVSLLYSGVGPLSGTTAIGTMTFTLA